MISISWFVAGVVVMSTILPWTICALFPITCLYGILLYYYRMTGIDMQRLDAKARSPIQALVSEGELRLEPRSLELLRVITLGVVSHFH